MRPFFDQETQLRPAVIFSERFKIRMTLGIPLVGGLGTLQTRRSPSAFWIASMSDFCFEEDACHVSIEMGEGDLAVLRVCRIVNCGCSAAKRMEPLRYPKA